VWSITFGLTVLADLTVAVEAGMILAALLYIRRVTTTTTVTRVTSDYIRQGRAHSLQLHDMPENVAIYRIHGPFLFGSTDKLLELEREMATLPKVVILRLRNMTAIDGTGLHALERLADALHRSGRFLLLCGMRDQPARMMQRAEFHEHIGTANLLPSVAAALARARVLLAEAPGGLSFSASTARRPSGPSQTGPDRPRNPARSAR
jgi:SulP family sulfate permease